MKRTPLKASKKLLAKTPLSSEKGLSPKKAKIKGKSNSLIHVADRVFSISVRRAHETEFGVRCYTCPSILPFAEIQLGHYVGRGRLDRRFDRRNCKPQCPTCNITKGGNLVEFKLQLVLEYGEKVVSSIEKYDLNFKLTDSYLNSIINECR
jgi:hypothetical protein